MKRLMNFLRGMVTLTVTGPFPERLVNLCAQEQVDFWAVTWLDGNTLRFVTRRRTLALLRRLAERVDCQVTVEKSWGLPDPVRLSGGTGPVPVRRGGAVPVRAYH